jgi:anti-sigma28 factor (negative regulator of flagellin synthesis)
MRIDPNAAITPISIETSKPEQPAKSRTKTGRASVVSLSSAAAAIPPDDGAPPAEVTARIEHIRAMLDKGDYPIDLDKLASRIVDDEILRSK